VSFLALIILTLFVESVIKPHTTGVVGIMESLGELCICAIVGFGYLASGEEHCAIPFRPRSPELRGHHLCHPVSIREDRLGSVSAYTVAIFVSLALYITPMALLVITHVANRVLPTAGRTHCHAARWMACAEHVWLHAQRRCAFRRYRAAVMCRTRLRDRRRKRKEDQAPPRCQGFRCTTGQPKAVESTTRDIQKTERVYRRCVRTGRPEG
jgi:hypothetical protein